MCVSERTSELSCTKSLGRYCIAAHTVDKRARLHIFIYAYIFIYIYIYIYIYRIYTYSHEHV